MNLAGLNLALTAAHDVGRADNDIGILRALAKRVLHHHQRQQRLGNRRGAYSDAGVVAAFGDHFRWRPRRVD